MNRKPLEGIQILEVGAYISAPYAGSLLAALGADVVKVEPPDGEPFRRGEGIGSPYFVQYNTGKKSIAVDLKSADGVKLIESLLPRFDVLIENMRPGKIAALGLGADVCRRINPRLVYASVSGFGSGGPLVDRPAYDSIGQSLGGLYSIMNDADDLRLTGTCIADLITAITATMGILAALVGRDREPDQHGTLVETSLLEAVSMLTIDAMTQAFETGEDPVRETRHPQAQNFCLHTASGQAITLHLSSSDKFWRALARAVGREDLLEDPRFRHYADRAIPENFAALKQMLEAEFAKRSRSELEQRLEEADVPFAPALTLREVAEHPQTRWLELFKHPAKGQALVQPPWRFDGSRPNRSERAPQVGEHTRQVVSEVRSDDELNALAAKGTIVMLEAAESSKQSTQNADR
jgi:crotonobetainyl-CoA:carnitine CoA-transferase CaiB-like acyl-CoA transferase